MNKRTLSLLIGVAIGASAGVAAAGPQDTTSRYLTEPPTAAEAAERERERLTDQGDDADARIDELHPLDDDAALADADPDALPIDDSRDQRHARTQSPANDPGHPAVEDDRIVVDQRDAVSESVVAVDTESTDETGSDADAVDYAEQPLAGGGAGNGSSAGGTGGDGSAFADSAGSSGFSDGATAQQAAGRFDRLDGDGSGELSEGELADQTALADRFEEYDINGDGQIAKNEYQSYFAAQQWLEGMDERERQLASSIDDGAAPAGDSDDAGSMAAVDADSDTGMDDGRTMDDDGRPRDRDTDATASVDADDFDSGLDRDIDADIDADVDLDADDIDTDVDSGESLLEDTDDGDQR